MAIFQRLLLRPGYGDDDVAQDIWNILSFFTFLMGIYNFKLVFSGFVHGKRKHIRWTVNSTVFQIQFVNAFVIDKSKIHFAFVNPFRFSSFLQNTLQQGDQLIAYRVFFLFVIPDDCKAHVVTAPSSFFGFFTSSGYSIRE
ncbi:hypothetical protein D3C74_316100 [compost metagenome]